jgi:hypothetical protein
MCGYIARDEADSETHLWQNGAESGIIVPAGKISPSILIVFLPFQKYARSFWLYSHLVQSIARSLQFAIAVVDVD